jgi:alpha-1,2-glucosyltransferase
VAVRGGATAVTFQLRGLLVSGLLCLTIAAAAYGGLQSVRGPVPIFMHVRWAPNIDAAGRQEAEQRYGLTQGEHLEGRNWGYTLTDLSTSNIRALVTDLVVEDTHEIDRVTFRPSPTAEERPQPSNSLITLSLWGTTVVGLFIGLTAVSLGLAHRAAGPAALRFADPVGTDQAVATRRLALLGLGAVLAGCFLLARTMEAKIDEANHLGQIQRYLAGNYVTTSTASGGFHALAAMFAWLAGDAEKESIRLFVLIVAFVTILTFQSLIESFEPQAATTRTLQFALFPLLFPFWYLIYTDVLALLLLLLAVLAVRRNHLHVSGIMMILSMAVRQSYVVWLALLGVWIAAMNAGISLRQLARRGLSFGFAAALFLLFVLLNDGVAIGDRDAHPEMELHTENLLFMLVCFFLTFLPLIASVLPRIRRLHPALLVAVPVLSIALLFGTFRVDHPYNDNAVTEDLFLRNELLQVITSSTIARAGASLAVAVAALSLFVIRLRQPIHYLIYPFAALSVMPAWLIEQRYYLPAFALFMVFRESASPTVERTLLAMNTGAALYLFAGIVQGRFFL